MEKPIGLTHEQADELCRILGEEDGAEFARMQHAILDEISGNRECIEARLSDNIADAESVDIRLNRGKIRVKADYLMVHNPGLEEEYYREPVLEDLNTSRESIVMNFSEGFAGLKSRIRVDRDNGLDRDIRVYWGVFAFPFGACSALIANMDYMAHPLAWAGTALAGAGASLLVYGGVQTYQRIKNSCVENFSLRNIDEAVPDEILQLKILDQVGMIPSYIERCRA